MFSFKAIAVLVLPLLAVANPLTVRTGSNQCNTGSLNCCEQTDTISGAGGGLLGGILNGLSIGTGCSSIIPIVEGSSCSQQTVCCTGNSFNGLIAFGCTPINLNL